MLLELIDNGMEAEKRKEQQVFSLSWRLRNVTAPKEIKRLGDEMGRWSSAADAQNQVLGKLPSGRSAATD